MGLVSWFVSGLIIGIIAQFFMPGKDPGGYVNTVILGIAGSFTGGFIGSRIGFGPVGNFDLRSLMIACGAAVLVLLVYRIFKQ